MKDLLYERNPVALALTVWKWHSFEVDQPFSKIGKKTSVFPQPPHMSDYQWFAIKGKPWVLKIWDPLFFVLHTYTWRGNVVWSVDIEARHYRYMGDAWTGNNFFQKVSFSDYWKNDSLFLYHVSVSQWQMTNDRKDRDFFYHISITLSLMTNDKW